MDKLHVVLLPLSLTLQSCFVTFRADSRCRLVSSAQGGDRASIDEPGDFDPIRSPQRPKHRVPIF